MYVWIGCRLPEAYERELRFGLRELNAEIGLEETAFALPQHISLKISFCVPDDRAEAVLMAVEALLAQEKPFVVHLNGAKIMQNVLYLDVKPNTVLKSLHAKLDAMLLKDFAVPQHAYDRDYRFHSTVFMDEDAEKLRKMHKIMAEFPNDETLGISQFLLGTSESGKPGTYRVVKEILV